MEVRVKDIVSAVPVWREYEIGFLDSLEETNRAPMTQRTYGVAVRQLGEFLASKGMPTDPANVSREHLGEWMRYMQRRAEDGGQGLTAQTALQRYRSASRFFLWLVKEGEIRESPMTRMEPPKVPEKLVPVVNDDALKKLFKTVDGTEFEARRDRAILSLFLDVGLRIAEMAGIKAADIDIDEREVRVMGKGRRARELRFTRETRADIQRYLRQRAKHPHHESPALWIGRQGPMTGSGIYRMVTRRADEAEIGHIHPHQLRHTFAHVYLRNGGNEGNLMRVTGWKSRSMVDRYGASVAASRAADAHDEFSPRKLV
ncbi:MAG: tyrosine-type recombinase/integrase [Dehalococcoidia bacterium]|nr:tyrosine-type recombinase/integrase [Dehalococcoidia bacterium]